MITNEYVFFTGRTKGEESCFSNFFKSNSGWFPTNEHYYMFQKASFFNDTSSMLAIMQTNNPAEVKKIGQTVVLFDDIKWDKVKLRYMYQGLKLKFDSNMNLKQFLLNTENQIIVEASPWDKYWGVGMAEANPLIHDSNNWLGKNMLGKLLMKLREEYKNTNLENST